MPSMASTRRMRLRVRKPAMFVGMVLWAASGHPLVAQPKQDDPVLSRGLVHSTRERATVLEAIASANKVLAAKGYTLFLAEVAAPAADLRLPVYLVRAMDRTKATPAAVPKGCRCIFVEADALAAWIKAHSEGSGRMALNTANVLAYMLIHEVGHVVNGNDAGAYDQGAWSQLNLEPSFAKANEEGADDFAAGLIRDLSNAQGGSAGALAASWISMELSKLSWNMQAYRTLDEFGASVMGKPVVYFDPSYSHPNLAWRVLRSNYLIHQSAETKALLDAFDAARQRGSSQAPLFRKQ
jgi:hypothetical protein